MMAKIFEVKAINRLSSTDIPGGKIPKTAGIESTAKIKSVHSTIISTKNKGVKYRRPF
jgi:predicted hotdog family 3-hydroxylacyl-ACP dehydratase